MACLPNTVEIPPFLICFTVAQSWATGNLHTHLSAFSLNTAHVPTAKPLWFKLTEVTCKYEQFCSISFNLYSHTRDPGMMHPISYTYKS